MWPDVNRPPLVDIVTATFRLVLGGVMVTAGALKLPDPAASVRAVRAFDLLPETVVPAVGYLLPGLEAVLGLMLIAGVLTRTAAVATALVQVAFIGAIAAAWARGLEIDCGCFGGGGYAEGASQKYPFDIARDVVSTAMAAWIVYHPVRRWDLDRFTATSRLTPVSEVPRGT